MPVGGRQAGKGAGWAQPSGSAPEQAARSSPKQGALGPRALPSTH